MVPRMDQPPPRAAIYARISQDRAGTRLGVDRQRDICADLAARRGWEVVAEYVDNDVSAYTGRRRPQYQAMLDAARTGQIDAIVVADLDRLTRSPRELEDVVDLADEHGTLVANAAGEYDLATSEGRLMARIAGSVARAESERKAERLQRERAQRAARGLPHPGPRRFGFLDGNVDHHPDEAALIREAADDVVAGRASLRAVALRWNDAGVTTARGRTWDISAVRDVLTSPTIAGLRAHRGTIVGEGAWEPIVDRETWELLAAAAAARQRPGRPPERLLSGILRCGRCGTGMVSSRGKGKDYYKCPTSPLGCSRLHITAEHVNRWIGDAVVHRLSGPRLDAAATDDTDQLGHELAATRDRLDTLADAYAAGTVSHDTYVRTTAALEARLDDLQAQAARRTAAAVLDVLPDTVDLAGWWDDPATTDTDRRAVVAAALQSVTVMPAEPGAPRVFDPGRLVDPVWKV